MAKKCNRGSKDFDRLVEQLEFAIPDLEEVYFAGGEPLIMKEHYEMLQLFIRRGKNGIKLRYNTNFSQTRFQGHDLFELWKEFDDVFVHASLDGMDAKGELQRNGQSWKQVTEERLRMKQVCPQVDFIVAPTISVFNVWHLPDFHREWVEAGLIDVDEFIPHVLKHPEYYNVRILPLDLKLKVQKKLQGHVQWMIAYAEENPPKVPSKAQKEKWASRLGWLKLEEITGHTKLDMLINELNNCMAYMQAEDQTHLIPEFIRVTNQLDDLRGEDTRQTFPELSQLWES